MRFNLEMPVDDGTEDASRTIELARAIERANFDGLGFTDHPAPSKKWLMAGGHRTYDPFVGLAFCAAVTTRVRLLTYLAVLPYRNPFMLVKSAATVDCLSGGRFTLVAGSGYLRSEFAALGEDFETRNALTDEALDVFTSVDDAEMTYKGNGFEAFSQICDPGFVQRPHPPVWIGGNSLKSRQRVAKWGDGWAPLINTPLSAETTKTSLLSSTESLRVAIEELFALTADAGRDPKQLSIQVDGFDGIDELLASPQAFADRVGELAAVGVTHTMLKTQRGVTSSQAVDQVLAIGEVFDSIG
jgi:probable F420-dependent oxidoreductase